MNETILFISACLIGALFLHRLTAAVVRLADIQEKRLRVQVEQNIRSNSTLGSMVKTIDGALRP